MEMFVKRFVQVGVVLAVALVMRPVDCAGQTPASAENRRQTASALEQQGNYAEAETAWRAVLKAHPADADAFAHLGLLEARQQHYKEAVPLYRKALALNPAMPGVRLNLGLALFKSGALNEAIQAFTPLLKSEPPSSPEALRVTTLIGLAHYGLGEYAAAIPYLKQATAADPQNLPFRLALAHSCLWSKQYQCVLDVYHEILTLNAESAEAEMPGPCSSSAPQSRPIHACRMCTSDWAICCGVSCNMRRRHRSSRPSLPTIRNTLRRWPIWPIPICA
jgi:tetratricopeptide (TPR) repeat protein